jgi:hypothetical protein
MRQRVRLILSSFESLIDLILSPLFMLGIIPQTRSRSSQHVVKRDE